MIAPTLAQWLNQFAKPNPKPNEYIPFAQGVTDTHRKQFFTNFDQDKMNRLREIKLNEKQ